MEKHDPIFTKGRKTMTSLMKKDSSVSVLCKAEESIHDEKAVYRLVKIDLIERQVFAVTVSFRGENAEAIVGGNEEKARRFFITVCTNSVTPCTFFDIFSDFLR